MSKDDLREAIFGSFDGMTSTLGVIAGLLVAGTHSGSRILAASIGLAIAATVGMAAGKYLSDTGRSIRLASVMGIATFTGAVAPALPFAIGYGTVQVLVSAGIIVGGGVLIGHYRGYRITFAMLTVVCILTVVLSALVA